MPQIMKSWLGSRSLLLHLLNLARQSPSILGNSFLFKALTLLLQEHYVNDWQSMVLWLQSKASFLLSSKWSGLQKCNKKKISLLTIHKLKILQGNTPIVYRNCFRLSEILFSVANCIFFLIYWHYLIFSCVMLKLGTLSVSNSPKHIKGNLLY